MDKREDCPLTTESEIKKERTLGNVARTAIFLVILILLMFFISRPFKIRDNRMYQIIAGMHDEPKDELDIIFIGASQTYASFCAPLAWEDYGLKTWAYSVPMLFPEVAKNYIIEARKTQSDALYVVTLNIFKIYSFTPSVMHYAVDYIPFSLNKIDMIEKSAKAAEISGEEKLELYFPFYRYHGSWSRMKEDSQNYYSTVKGFKSGSYYSIFLNTQSNINYREYVATNNRVELRESHKEALDEIMDYCEENGIKLAFQIIPQALEDESNAALLNEAKRIVEERGYVCIDSFDATKDIGLNMAKDYYDERHMNIHGAIKNTDYMMKQLIEAFPYLLSENGKGKDDESWNEAYEKYLDVIGPWTLDIERSHEKRDISMEAPSITIRRDDDYFSIRWKVDDETNIEGYRVYRRSYYGKQEDPKWTRYELVFETTKEIHEYIDKDLESETTYAYTVIPFREEDGERIYGDFEYNGKTGVGMMEGPVLLSLEDRGYDGVLVEWEEYPEAISYKVYRRQCGQVDNWILLDTLDADPSKGEELETSYVDYYAQDDLPYVYSVQAVVTDKMTGDPISTGYRKTGLLLWRDVPAPSAEISKPKDKAVITWERVKSADYYIIYKRINEGEWEKIFDREKYNDLTQKLKKEGTYNDKGPFTFTDPEKLENGKYEYRLVPVIENGFDTELIQLPDITLTLVN